MKQVNDLIKESMKNGNKMALGAYRSVKAKMLNELTKAKTNYTEDDPQLFTDMIRREVKEQMDTIEQIGDEANELVQGAKKIVDFLTDTHLPKKMSEDDQLQLIKDIIAELNAEKKDMGKVMGQLSAKKDVLDMKFVSQKVKELLV